jgi:hypothetical protein
MKTTSVTTRLKFVVPANHEHLVREKEFDAEDKGDDFE